jgi:hypothetical protein
MTNAEDLAELLKEDVIPEIEEAIDELFESIANTKQASKEDKEALNEFQELRKEFQLLLEEVEAGELDEEECAGIIDEIDMMRSEEEGD